MSMMVVWAILIVLGIYALIKWISHMRSPGSHERLRPAENTALQMLDERYARGELDREDFLQRREDLTRNGKNAFQLKITRLQYLLGVDGLPFSGC